MLPHTLKLHPAVVALIFGAIAFHAPAAQQPAGAPQTQPAQPPSKPAAADSTAAAPGNTEEEISQMLVGKRLFLRGGYLSNHLSFDADGQLAGESPRGSYTLCAVEIKKVHLTASRLELSGQRYGLHFLGALASESSDSSIDQVQLTSDKQDLSIDIDREVVGEPKALRLLTFKFRHSKKAAPPAPGSPAISPAQNADTASTSSPNPANPPVATTKTPPAPPLTQEKADQTLKAALDRIFAQGIDSRLIASMPPFWQLYYQAAANKTDYTPKDPTVLRQNMVDRKARLLSSFVPPSNEYAQSHSVSGMALYHVVVGADGKPNEIAVARPIGFGLDENAVAAIRKASFEPAIKDGKPVPVMLDLVVEFRIYSDRTATHDTPAPAQPSAPVLPGPYSVQHP